MDLEGEERRKGVRLGERKRVSYGGMASERESECGRTVLSGSRSSFFS